MHIYAFGSLCRGEVDFGSDVDLLSIIEGPDSRFDPDVFAKYSYDRIRSLWKEGNPFAWHLATEARLIFASDARNFLLDLGRPAPYGRCAEDCQKFFRVYEVAFEALTSGKCSLVFELATVFLAVRNFATCFSLGMTKQPNFSRHSAKEIGERSLNISDGAYRLLERSRILAIRATGPMIQAQELQACLEDVCAIRSWMQKLLTEVKPDG